MSSLDFSKCACREHPTSWWFPISATSRKESARALQICGTCDQRQECLMYALRNETHGIWGGMGEAERELERRRRNIQLTPQAISSMSVTTYRAAKRLNQEETI